MNRIKILVLVVLLPLIGLAQDGMTLEEYRYLTKGYAYQIEMGLDPSKAGYVIEEADLEDGIEMVALIKENETIPQGLLFVITNATEVPTYICLPNNNAHPRVMDLYKMNQQNLTNPTICEKYQDALRQMLFYSFSQNNQPIDEVAPDQLTSALEKVAKKETLNTKGNIPIEYSHETNAKPAEQIETKNVNTNVTIQLGGIIQERTLINQPIITQSHQKQGKIVVKICVNDHGKVISAKFTQRGSTTLDRQLQQMAINSAKKTIFAENDILKSCGTIAYHFK